MNTEVWNPYSIIALTALLISAITFISTQFGERRHVSREYIRQLETRVATLERELEVANSHIRELEAQNAHQLKENIALLRKLSRMDNYNAGRLKRYDDDDNGRAKTKPKPKHK